ncbi:Protein SDA1 homolog [Linum grandiflorum]
MSTGNHQTSGGSMAESLSASGKSSEKLSLPSLQSKMKIDPEGYTTELGLIYSQFNCALDLFQQQAALSFASASGVCADATIAKELGDRTMFLAHVAPFYSKELARFPGQLVDFLKSSAKSLPFGLRGNVTQALILLVNRQMVDIKDALALFMELQTVGDRNLRKLAFSHVVNSIKRMNKKHKNEAKNRALQNILFTMLQQEDESLAKRALITLCELHRRKVWFDDRTANAICMACFHPSSRIMIAALSFVLDFEKMQDDHNSDSEDMSSDDDANPRHAQVAINKAAIYKANHTGTSASKKKKKAKLERAVRSMKRKQRLASEQTSSNYYSPLNHLNDAQGFAEKLFSRLKTCNERFEVKMMLMKVIARTIGLHHLILLSFYPFLQKYCQPHQRDVTNLLAAAVQACHDMVPPDAVEPLFRQIVNQFVHDHSRPEAIAIGLNVVREICLRIPLLMTEDLLQDLVLYRKQHEKAVSAAARSLLVLFREICPSLLVKKDRGRPIDPKVKPKAYGENHVPSTVPGIELLDEGADTESDEDVEDDGDDSQSDAGPDYPSNRELFGSDDEENAVEDDEDDGSDDDDLRADLDDSDDNADEIGSGEDDGEEEDDDEVDEESEDEEGEEDDADDEVEASKSVSNKRKRSDFNGELIAADTSLRALKKLAGENQKPSSSDPGDGFLSQEDFKRIRELKAKKEAKIALTRHGFKLPSSDQLAMKPMDPSTLEAHIRHKMNKEERLQLVKAGREDRGEYRAKSAIKKNKTGGLSNQQKNHKKKMPLAAKRSTIVRNRAQKRKKSDRLGKQFRGKKAWK